MSLLPGQKITKDNVQGLIIGHSIVIASHRGKAYSGVVNEVKDYGKGDWVIHAGGLSGAVHLFSYVGELDVSERLEEIKQEFLSEVRKAYRDALRKLPPDVDAGLFVYPAQDALSLFSPWMNNLGDD